MKKFNVITNAVSLFVHEATFESKPHLVAPCVLLVAGVHNGVLYTAEELAKYPSAWDGIPLPIKHPMENGAPISANQPSILETQSVGYLFNVSYEPDKKRLMGEIWVDVNKAEVIEPEVLVAVRDNKQLEVSTGLYFDEEMVEGEWGGESYTSVAHNFRPDHLALLPGGTGACSWADGCGVRANEKSPEKKTVLHRLNSILKEVSWLCGFAKINVNEDSHDELWSKLSRAVSSLDTDSWNHWLRDVYDDHIIYTAHGDKNPNEPGSAGTELLYKRNYTIGADDEVTLADETIEVTQEKTYVPVGNAAAGAAPEPGTKPKETKTMENNDAVVQALVDCDRTRLKAADATWLKTLSAEQLDSLKALDAPCPDDKPAANADDKPDALPATDDKPDAEDKPVTLEEFIATAPPEVAETLKRSVAADARAKEVVVNKLVKNERCTFTKEQLIAKSLEELTALAELANVPIDFSGQAGAPTPAANEDDPPAMPPVFEEKK